MGLINKVDMVCLSPVGYGVTVTQLVQVYGGIRRSVLEYACPVWAALPQYLNDVIETVQKRELGIVIPKVYYRMHLLNPALLLFLKEVGKHT